MPNLRPSELLLLLVIVGIPVAVVWFTVTLVRRSSQATRSEPAVRVPPTAGQPARTNNIHRIPVDGGTIVFTRTDDGQVVTTAEGFGGRPSPDTVRGAQQRLIGWQTARNETPWFE